MSDLIRTTGQNLWLWRTIIFTGINGYFIAVAGAIMAAHILTPHQESWLGCFIVGAKFLEGFIHQGIALLKQQISASFDTSSLWRRAVIPSQQTETQTPPANPANPNPTQNA